MVPEYKEVAIDDIAAARQGTLFTKWTLDGWEVLGLHSKGSRGKKQRLVAILRRPRHEEDASLGV